MRNMEFPVGQLAGAEFPAGLREIPHPPVDLYYRGTLPPPDLPLLSVVGSRRYTTYGKQVVDELIGGLAGYPIGIVSGLALGIDSLAHEAALKSQLYTLAIPGGGLSDDCLYPASHRPLAFRIMEAGGGLLSEFAPDFKATNWSFPMRNRLVAGISRATLLIEAAPKSGTLITARLTVDYNRELLVVPGSIFSENSRGVHQFLKLGATPVTTADDILTVFGLEVARPKAAPLPISLSPLEQKIYNLLTEPIHRDELIRRLGIPVAEIAPTLTLLEIQGYISSEQNIFRRTNSP